jgi:predicted RNA polymerase sigma factor
MKASLGWRHARHRRNAVAWLVSAGQFRAIDRLRRDKRFMSSEDATEPAEAVAGEAIRLARSLHRLLPKRQLALHQPAKRGG